MKTTFDLPEPLLRRAKAAAAHQGRPLRDLVADALESKLSADDALARAAAEQDSAWAAFTLRLQKLPDGTYFNPEGIADEGFFEALDLVRAEGRAVAAARSLGARQHGNRTGSGAGKQQGRKHGGTRGKAPSMTGWLTVYLIDTKVLSEIIRPRPNLKVARQLLATFRQRLPTLPECHPPHAPPRPRRRPDRRRET